MFPWIFFSAVSRFTFDWVFFPLMKCYLNFWFKAFASLNHQFKTADVKVFCFYYQQSRIETFDKRFVKDFWSEPACCDSNMSLAQLNYRVNQINFNSFALPMSHSSRYSNESQTNLINIEPEFHIEIELNFNRHAMTSSNFETNWNTWGCGHA